MLVTGLLDQWGSTQHWVHSDGSIDWPALLSRYSDLEAPVHRLDRDGECCVQTMTFGEFAAASFGISLDGSSSGGCESTAQASLYLKDWHLARLRPEPPFYRLPLICSDDWCVLLALPPSTAAPQTRISMGASGSIVPLDVAAASMTAFPSSLSTTIDSCTLASAVHRRDSMLMCSDRTVGLPMSLVASDGMGGAGIARIVTVSLTNRATGRCSIRRKRTCSRTTRAR